MSFLKIEKKIFGLQLQKTDSFKMMDIGTLIFLQKSFYRTYLPENQIQDILQDRQQPGQKIDKWPLQLNNSACPWFGMSFESNSKPVIGPRPKKLCSLLLKVRVSKCPYFSLMSSKVGGLILSEAAELKTVTQSKTVLIIINLWKKNVAWLS